MKPSREQNKYDTIAEDTLTFSEEGEDFSTAPVRSPLPGDAAPPQHSQHKHPAVQRGQGEG